MLCRMELVKAAVFGMASHLAFVVVPYFLPFDPERCIFGILFLR